MNRIQTACFCLIASAFVLAAILVVRVDQQSASNAAHADMVIAQPQFTMMTARTRGGGGGNNGNAGDESLFILENTRGILLVYTPNIGREQLTPITSIKMSEIFGK
ncbi:MAG: hypothetical protein KTR15_15505 [Phycisphaeraceae bacterium]|nr:hypothetical protein [Phycisphaeraceae bacterium]